MGEKVGLFTGERLGEAVGAVVGSVCIHNSVKPDAWGEKKRENLTSVTYPVAERSEHIGIIQIYARKRKNMRKRGGDKSYKLPENSSNIKRLSPLIVSTPDTFPYKQ